MLHSIAYGGISLYGVESEGRISLECDTYGDHKSEQALVRSITVGHVVPAKGTVFVNGRSGKELGWSILT